MYRNIVYNPYDQEMNLFTWNNEGERTLVKEPFKPYLYIEDVEGRDGISIYDTPLKKLTFENSLKRKQFVLTTPRTFFNLSPEQQFLIERYQGLNKSDDFSLNPIRIFFLDIETYSPDGFPNPQLANDTINLITVFDSLSGGYYSFGLRKDYYPNDDRVIYRAFENEEDLIKTFIRWWRKNYPDILTTWYGDGFDLPYLCRRINKIYNDPEACNRLSPLGRVYKQDNVKKRLAEYKELWHISGITHLDYQYIYKVFTREPRASYSLQAIGEEELGYGKLEHNAVSLSTLADTDWQLFCDYNIQDVRLLVNLEDKLQYLKICRELAYQGLCPFSQAVSTVGLVTGIVAQKALEKNKILSTFTPMEVNQFAGGFVREPQTGIQKSLLYFDANSLYPNTIVTLNISPETKFAKIIEKNDEKKSITLVTSKGQTLTLDQEKFDKFIKSEEISLSKSNILFTQKTRGIIPTIIEENYAQRVATKQKIKELKKQIETCETNTNPTGINIKQLKLQIEQLEIRQYTIKIFLNRIYGYFAEKHSPIYDIDLASSVTLTGQSCIKEAAEISTKHLTTKYNLTYDPIIMGDTDSVVISIEPILQKLNTTCLIDDEINPIVYEIAEDVKTVIDKGINQWAKDILNSNYSTYEFKRENITSAGAFLAKKHYILNIRDEDDKKVDKFKYVGVEVVRTGTPKKVKPLIKEAIETIIKTNDPKQVQALLAKIYEKYNKLSIEEIAKPMGLNGYVKYLAKSDGFKIALKTPNQVKGAIYFNYLLKILEIDNKYESLKDGNKMKVMYLTPNKYNISVISFLNKFPDELAQLFQPDRKLMFEKMVLSPIERVLDAINWKLKSPTLEEKVDLLDLFS